MRLAKPCVSILAAASLLVAATLATAALRSPQAASPFAYHHETAAPAATDDPIPADCPFCGGDPVVHARRINAIAYSSARIAYRLLDNSLF